MPRYDYRCEDNHINESVQGMAVEVIPCPDCGKPALRQAVYRNQYISGETVAKGRTMGMQEALDRHGRYQLKKLEEAHNETQRAYERAGVSPPDTYSIAKARAARLRRAGVRTLGPETARADPPENAMMPAARNRRRGG